MRVLVTGGAGFIGSFTVDELAARGHEVRILDNLSPQVHPAGRPNWINPRAELIVADVRSRPALTAALADIDAVVHCAGAVGVAQSQYEIGHYTSVNVHGTGLLLECLVEQRSRRFRLVVPTSMTGYGEGQYERLSDGAPVRVAVRTEEDVRTNGWEPVCQATGAALRAAPTSEDAALLARNVYALTKRHQEELALAVGGYYGFGVTCLRLFNVYGPRQSLSNPYTGVLAIFLSRLLAGERPTVFEDGCQTRDFVSVHDVARATVDVLERDDRGAGIINIGSGVARRISDCARDIARLVARPELTPDIAGLFRRGDIRHCTADISRARAALDFHPRMSWDEGLEELCTWARTSPYDDRTSQSTSELAARGLLVVAGAGASPSPGQVGDRIESGPPTGSRATREAGGSQA